MDEAPSAPPRWRKQSIEGIQPGTVFSFSRTFTAQDVAAFGEVTRDFNPVHYDERFASSKGFFSGRSYLEKVKIAAGKAAASITRR